LKSDGLTGRAVKLAAEATGRQLRWNFVQACSKSRQDLRDNLRQSSKPGIFPMLRLCASNINNIKKIAPGMAEQVAGEMYLSQKCFTCFTTNSLPVLWNSRDRFLKLPCQPWMPLFQNLDYQSHRCHTTLTLAQRRRWCQPTTG